MKRIIIYSILFAFTLLNACRKSDNPKIPTLARAPIPQLTIDPNGDAAISGLDPGSFAGKVIVDMFFKTDVTPQKVNVVVIKNGDKTNPQIIQANVTTFPTTIDVTGAQLATLFGEPIVTGDNFEIGADITNVSGQTFQAFPAVGSAYGAGVNGEYGGTSTTVNFLAVCVFDKASFNGNYKVAQDDWADFAVGDLIEVKPGAGDNEISITAYPSPDYGTNRKAMIVTVNPDTYEVTVPEQIIGDYDGAPAGATVKGIGTLNPCGDNITLTLTFNLGGDEYADNVLILEK